MIFDLVKDFADVLDVMPLEHPRRRIVALLDEAIRRDVHFIDRHPTTLFQCLWNTCWWYDCPEAAGHYSVGNRLTDAPVPWNQPGPSLHELLEYWDKIKQRHTPDVYWLRALRPPALSLAASQIAVYPLESFGNCVATFPAARRIVASDYSTMHVWDTDTSQEVFCLQGHTNTIVHTATASTGRILSVANEQRTVRQWDVFSGQELQELWAEEAHRAADLCFLPDGRHILTAGRDGTLRRWSAVDGVLQACLCSGQRRLYTVCVSADGNDAAIAGDDRTIRLVDVETLTVRAASPRVASHVVQLRFSPTGEFLVGACSDGTVRAWNPDDWSERWRLEGHSATVWSLDWSPSGDFLVSGGADRTVRVWSVNAQKEQACLTGHTDAVASVAWSADGMLVASASIDKTIRVWDATSHQLRSCLKGHTGAVLSIAFTPKGDRLLSGGHDKTVRLWDVVAGTEVEFLPQVQADLLRRMPQLSRPQLTMLAGPQVIVERVAVSPSGALFVGSSVDVVRARIFIWSADTEAKVVCAKSGRRTISCAAYSPDGKRIATGGTDGDVWLWDALSGNCLRWLRGDQGRVQNVWFSPDGKSIWAVTGGQILSWDTQAGSDPLRRVDPVGQTIAYGFDGDQLTLVGKEQSVATIWEPLTGSERVTIQHDSEITSAAYIAARTAVGCHDGTIHVWDSHSGEGLQCLYGHDAPVSSLAWLDEWSLVSLAGDRTVRQWRILTGLAALRRRGVTGKVSCFCIAPGGDRIVLGDTGQVVSIPTGEMIRELEGYARLPQAIVYSPDGRFIVTAGGMDQTICLWEVETGRQRFSIHAAEGIVWRAQFCHNGEHIVAGIERYKEDDTIGGTSNLIQIRDIESGAVLNSFSGNDRDFDKLADPAYAGKQCDPGDTVIEVGDKYTRRQVAWGRHELIAFHSSSRRVVCADGRHLHFFEIVGASPNCALFRSL